MNLNYFEKALEACNFSLDNDNKFIKVYISFSSFKNNNEKLVIPPKSRNLYGTQKISRSY